MTSKNARREKIPLVEVGAADQQPEQGKGREHICSFKDKRLFHAEEIKHPSEQRGSEHRGKGTEDGQQRDGIGAASHQLNHHPGSKHKANPFLTSKGKGNQIVGQVDAAG